MNVFEQILEKLEETKELYVKLQLGTNRDSEKIAYCGKEQAMDIAISIVKEAEKEHNNGWIPCTERMPSIYCGFVLYTDKDGEVDVCSTDYFYDYLDRFIAWRELPEPYKESEQG